MGELAQAIQKLLWSLWSELGVPGGGRLHRGTAIDPEPLITFTPLLAARDHRLLGLAFDWCAAHAAQISKTRLGGLGRTLPGSVREPLAAFNGALRSDGVDWQPASEPLDLQRSRERMALPMERPALLAFRMRAIAGVSARADVLTRLVFVEGGGASVAELTPSGMSRRGAEITLNDLASAGLLQVHGSPRRRRFSLKDRASFSRFTGAGSLVWRDWHQTLTLLARLLDFAEAKDPSPRINRIAAVAARRGLAGLAPTAGVALPPALEEAPNAFDALAEWGLDAARALARGP